MTDIGSIRSFITADSTDFDHGLDRAGQKLDSFEKRAIEGFGNVGKAMKDMGRTLSVAVTLPLAAAGAGFLKLASDAEETQNKFDVVFDGLASEANMAAQTIADSFGIASDQSQKLLADTGDLLTGFGFSREAALKLATEVNILAADLASFTNIEGGAAKASEALTKALLGESEQAKALGIVIRQDSKEYINLVEQQMAVNGVSLLQAKALAALEISTKQSQNAIGDFERSQHSFANQMKIATAEVRDMAVSFGQQLMPAALMALQWARDIGRAFGDLSPQTQRLAIVIGVVAAAIGPLLFVGGALITMFVGMLSAVAPAVIVLGTVGAALVALPSAVNIVVSAFRGMSDFFGNFSAFISGEWADLSEDSKTAIEIIAKGWLSLKIVWSAVGNFLVGTIRVITEAISKFIGGIEWMAEKIGVDMPEGVKNFKASMDDVTATLKDVERQNANTLAELTSQWDEAPELLREDVNSLVDTFKALPEGIVTQLEQAFPGAVEAVRNLVAQVQEFINSGELPPINIPVVPTIGVEEGAGAMGGVSDMAAIGAEISKFEKEQEKTTKKIRSLWMGVAGTYAQAFSAMSAVMKKGSTEQKAFAVISIIIDTATAIMKAFATYGPTPPGFAAAAAMAVIGAAQLAAVGGGGGGGGTTTGVAASGDFSDQTRVSPAAQQSQVIGTPESELENAGDIPVVKLIAEGDDMVAIVTRGVASRGAGDGVNTLALQGT